MPFTFLVLYPYRPKLIVFCEDTEHGTRIMKSRKDMSLIFFITDRIAE